MLELREFDLQFAFLRARALGEDVEDQGGAIEDFALETFFKIAALRRREFVVKDNRVDILPAAIVGPFPGLAGADKRASDRRGEFLHAAAYHLAAGGARQFAQLGHRILDLPRRAAFEFDAGEEDTLGPAICCFNECFQSTIGGLL